MKHISSIDRGDVKLAYDRAVAHDVEDVADMLEAFAEYIDRLEKQRDELLAALERLSFAAMCRDNTMGDPSRLIEVKAELSAANEQAIAAIARVKGEEVQP